jgi:hypothetical protein
MRENTWRCPEDVEPQNPSQTLMPHPASTHGRHSEFDLDLKWGQRKFKKFKKNENPACGVMICDVVPRKNIKHDIPKSHRKTLHKK